MIKGFEVLTVDGLPDEEHKSLIYFDLCKKVSFLGIVKVSLLGEEANI